ncbi:beta-1,3-galactosyltransferase [Salix suchowensis]|nr:beta-1,3-galactosyltransferase [Salix suchowensis]
MLGGSKGFNTNRPSSSLVSGSRIYTLLFSMFATFASVYVSGRLWQESQNRVYLIKELDRITGQGQSAISVDDTLKIIACREQQKKLSALETELAAAKQEGFTSKVLTENDGAHAKKRQLVVIGIMTRFGNKNNRDAVRKAWMGTGAILKKMENEKGIVARFVIGKSANPGDNMDRGIDIENRQSNDFIILDDLVEGTEDLPKKARLFFTYAAERWDAEFYAKVNDNIYVTIDALGTALAAHFDKPRAYIGCMKSGQVYSEPSHKWYEPDWWKFGDKKSYFRHASGEMYVISRALAKFVSINRSILRTYAHDDVSAGSWFLGLDVLHVDEGKFCCSSWTSGAICSGV